MTDEGPDLGLFAADADATPLTAEEREGLIPSHIALRSELNAAEQANIAKAHASLFGRRKPFTPDQLVIEDFVKRTHLAMYGDVWRWAGQYRRSEKNIGIPWIQIPVEMHAFLGDAAAWLATKSYPPDELAVRFHHRLVFIHAFPNGNGRHSRTMADLMILALGQERFSWGGANLADITETRRRYIDALHAADGFDILPLIAFARS